MKDYKKKTKKNPGIHIYIQNTLDFCSRFSVIVLRTSYTVVYHTLTTGGILQGETLTVCFNDLSVFTEVEIPKPFVSK